MLRKYLKKRLRQIGSKLRQYEKKEGNMTIQDSFKLQYLKGQLDIVEEMVKKIQEVE